MRAREFVKEVNAPGQLTVPEELVQRFTTAGWQIVGEGNDQIVLGKPNSNYVLKIVGQGSKSRIDQIRRYIDFYRRNQRNPHWPRVGGDRLLKWGDKTYYAYTQEKLQHLPGDEAVLDYLEYAMSEISHGEEPDFAKIPPGLSARDIDGLMNAVDALFSADIGGQYQFDLSNVYNIMQRPNGQLVIVDPFAGWDDDEALDESAVAEGRGVKQQIEEFLDSLSPDDVGVEEFPGYRVHYEGFTDECKSSSDYQKNPNRVYKQVYQDFIDREGGRKPVKSGMVGDEEYPIFYSVFKVPQSKTIDTAEKAYSIAYKKKQPWPRGSREEKLIRSDWQLSGLYDQYVLKQDMAEDTPLPGDFKLMGQNLFLKNLARNLKQRYPDATVKLSSDRVTAYYNKGDDEALSVMGTEVMDSGYIGVGLDDAFTESFQGVLVPTIKQTTEQLLAANPGTKPALFLSTDNWNPDAWTHIANKLGYRLVADDEPLDENFADGKVRGKSRPGRVRRAGASCAGSVTDLRAKAKKYGGERGKMYHWCANMKSGRKK